MDWKATFTCKAGGFGNFKFGAHTRTIQARHMVRSLLSETYLRELMSGNVGIHARTCPEAGELLVPCR